MEFPKIFSTKSGTTLLPETLGNRFQLLTFAKFERQTLWNAIEQRTSSCLNTALKVLLTIPSFLMQKITQATQTLHSANIALGDYLYPKRTILAVTPPTINKPLLNDSKKDGSKTEIVKPPELDYLEQVKISFARIKNPSEQLRYAAEQGYLEGVKIALDNPETNINYQQGRFGDSTALMRAAKKGHKEIVELLLEAGANPNIVDASGMIDCEFNVEGGSSKTGNTALMNAALGRNGINNAEYKEIVELLLNANANPNIQDLSGNTALILAAEHGKTEVVELLLKREANPNIQQFKINSVTARSQNDWTALMEASRNGHKDVVESLLNAKANPNIQSQYGSTALTLAAEKGHLDTVRLLLKAKADPNAQNKKGIAALISAAGCGYTEIVQELIAVNADLNIQDRIGMTPLLLAADHGHTEIVRLLINAKADLNIQSQYGTTALILAAIMGFEDNVKLLIKAKADLNIQAICGSTALIGASWKVHKNIIKLLLEAGADASIKNNKGNTVLFYVKNFRPPDKDLVQLIISHLNTPFKSL